VATNESSSTCNQERLRQSCGDVYADSSAYVTCPDTSSRPLTLAWMDRSWILRVCEFLQYCTANYSNAALSA